MKIFYTYTNNFKILLDYYLESIHDTCLDHFPINFDYIYDIEKEQKIQGNDIQPGGGHYGCIARKNLIDYALTKTQTNEYFILSDIDIIFYQPIVPYIKELIKSMNDTDIFFQKEIDILDKKYRMSQVNIGFMIIKNTKSVKYFWDSIYDQIFKDYLWEQPTTNLFLQNNYKTDIEIFHKQTESLPSVSVLSEDFFCMSQINCIFDNNTPLPKNMILHHATCVLSIEDKLKQFDQIKSAMNQRYNVKPKNI